MNYTKILFGLILFISVIAAQTPFALGQAEMCSGSLCNYTETIIHAGYQPIFVFDFSNNIDELQYQMTDVSFYLYSTDVLGGYRIYDAQLIDTKAVYTYSESSFNTYTKTADDFYVGVIHPSITTHTDRHNAIREVNATAKFYWCVSSLCNPIEFRDITFDRNSDSTLAGEYDAGTTDREVVYTDKWPKIEVYVPSSLSVVTLKGTDIDYYNISIIVGADKKFMLSSYDFATDNVVYLYPYSEYYVYVNRTDGTEVNSSITLLCSGSYCELDLDSLFDAAASSSTQTLYGAKITCEKTFDENNTYMNISCSAISGSSDTSWNWQVSYLNGTNSTYTDVGSDVSRSFSNVTYIIVYADDGKIYESGLNVWEINKYGLLLLLALIPTLILMRGIVSMLIGVGLSLFLVDTFGFADIPSYVYVGIVTILIVIIIFDRVKK